jgi:hypothetical protein
LKVGATSFSHSFVSTSGVQDEKVCTSLRTDGDGTSITSAQQDRRGGEGSNPLILRTDASRETRSEVCEAMKLFTWSCLDSSEQKGIENVKRAAEDANVSV